MLATVAHRSDDLFKAEQWGGREKQDRALTPLIGRSVEKAALVKLLADGGIRLVTVTGRGGIGKTRLVTEAARAMSVSSTQPVLFVSLVGVADPRGVTAEIAAQTGLSNIENGEATNGLVQRLQHEPALLVLDNFEHVLEARQDVSTLLDRCQQLQVLVTSQARLGVGEERVFEVSALPVPDQAECQVKLMTSCPSVALYCERARAVDRAFVLDEANAAAVGELCRRLEGLPLAIELAAARAVTLPAADIVRHFDTSGLTLLRSRRLDAPARHQDLKATIEWTYQLLSPGEQGLLRRLSLLSGTFDLDAVVALGEPVAIADVVDELESLIEVHLVNRVGTCDQARFVLAVSIRLFAQEQLDETGELATTRQQHIGYRAGQARTAAAAIFATDDADWLGVLQANHDDFYGALIAALDAGSPEAALELVVGLAHLWSRRSYYEAQEQLLERALELASGTGLATAAYATALVLSAQLGFQQRPHPQRGVLLARLQHGEDLSRDLRDDSALLRALIGRILTAPYTFRIAEATAAANEGLQLAEHMDDDRHLGRIQAWSGMLAQQLGDDDRAIMLGRDALALARTSGDQRTLVLATMLLLPLQRKHPNLVVDVPDPEEALRAARAAGLLMYETLLLPMTAYQHLASRDIDTALTWAKESLTNALNMPESPAAHYSLVTAASIAADLGDDERAAFFYGTVRDEMPTLSRAVVPQELAAYNQMLKRVESSLGPQRFEAAVQRGAHLASHSALSQALRYVEDTKATRDAVRQRSALSAPALTERRRDVLALLVEGLSNKEIAAKLDIAPKTVMHHVATLYQILGVENRAEAVATAVREGLVADRC
jgi:predicted ATPase/DNA-binding NarL/FixJ family response regulator